MKNDSISAVIIDDDSDEEVIVIPQKTKRVIKKQEPLKKFHLDNPTIFEIGVDEAGRGPMFGRVYTAGVILPKDDTFDHSKVKDSKKFTSKKKIEEAADYIIKGTEGAIEAKTVTYDFERLMENATCLSSLEFGEAIIKHM